MMIVAMRVSTVLADLIRGHPLWAFVIVATVTLLWLILGYGRRGRRSRSARAIYTTVPQPMPKGGGGVQGGFSALDDWPPPLFEDWLAHASQYRPYPDPVIQQARVAFEGGDVDAAAAVLEAEEAREMSGPPEQMRGLVERARAERAVGRELGKCRARNGNGP
jgi:hypothetical protein